MASATPLNEARLSEPARGRCESPAVGGPVEDRVNEDRSRVQIDDPRLVHVRPSMEVRLDARILAQARLGDFDDEEGVSRMRAPVIAGRYQRQVREHGSPGRLRNVPVAANFSVIVDKWTSRRSQLR